MYENNGGNAITMLKKDSSSSSLRQRVESAYTYRKDAKWPWLQRKLLWGLEKLKAYHYETISTDTATYTDINNDTILRMVMRHRDEYLKRGYNGELAVLIGYRTWIKLVRGEMSAHAPTSFSYSMVDYAGREIMGMKVVVVDLMDGIVIVPKQDII